MVPARIAGTGLARAPHNPCCSVPESAASQVPPASSQKAGTMHQHAKKNSIDGPKTTAPPPSGLARRPRRIHTKSTAPTTPTTTDSASSGDAVLKW